LLRKKEITAETVGNSREKKKENPERKGVTLVKARKQKKDRDGPEKLRIGVSLVLNLIRQRDGDSLCSREERANRIGARTRGGKGSQTVG